MKVNPLHAVWGENELVAAINLSREGQIIIRVNRWLGCGGATAECDEQEDREYGRKDSHG